ncbi:non-ribosomal peptide synthetase [Streptomyces spectabilis]|uniref:Amino acid adenylation domain-containing protein n=1 Tax=Streptomyces spectabilis TaxID=68270 RepID=A0A516RHP4_STRST|nr:non-ribosomal peptide synthetase [Streptomyces spectabilis]QDQ15180.1 amino acid adenylation domain-containing protein [Streptomyces spectabilis]
MPSTLLEAISSRTTRQPHATALDLNGRTLTYAELAHRSGALAEELMAAGAGSGDVVGVLTHADLDLVPALLGVLRSKAAYLPLDPRNSPAQIARLMAAAGSRFVVGADSLRHRLDMAPDVTVVPPPRSSDPHDAVNPPVRPTDPAYVVFTSGTTGEPKGVVVPHRALLQHAGEMARSFGLTSRDRVLQFATIGFDVAAEEIFPTLVAGGCVVLCPDPPAPRELTRVLADGRITVANLPSGYWQQWSAGRGSEPLPPWLRLVVIGSEGVDASAAVAWCGSTHVALLNAYGLTETTITSLVHRVDADADTEVVAVGRPIAGVTAHVLDPDLRPVSGSGEGELYIGGAGVASGYLGRPEETARRFLPDPFSAVTGALMHRTGDRARRRPDGTVEVLGRMDDQIKVNGHRVEPAQVEAALAAHPLVALAAVAVRQDPAGGRRLVGYVVLRDGGTHVPMDLRAHLSERLTAHLLPAALVAVPELPVTRNGKLDRDALPDPGHHVRREPLTDPRSALESRLLDIWREVLGTDDIGVRDSFFDVGGTSGSLAAVLSRINAFRSEPVGLLTLFEHPTIAQLATHLTEPVAAPAAPERRVRPAVRRRRAAG